jgi:lipid-A-disaccharide synthase
MDQDRPVRIAMVAGEPSSDLIASLLIPALKAHLPQARFYGIGGNKMRAQGFESWYPEEKLAVHGYAEALRHYREIMGIRRQLADRLIAEPPDLFIGIDAPDFNFGLERRLKEAGITAVHYVGPSIWAWRGWRIKGIAQAVSHMLVMFPFEPPIYEKAGVPVSYVGHPLADVIPLQPDSVAARARLGLPLAAEGREIIGVMPGSRRGELTRMADIFVRTIELVAQQKPNAVFPVPLATQATRELFEAALAKSPIAQRAVRLVAGQSHDVIAASDFMIACSGTATLEVALFKKPMVIVYQWSPWTWALMKRMLYIPYIGLPNILSGAFVVPEYIQEKAIPADIAKGALDLMADRPRIRALEARFSEMHVTLRQNTAHKAAQALLPLLAQQRS